jgi:hypothetical protein
MHHLLLNTGSSMDCVRRQEMKWNSMQRQFTAVSSNLAGTKCCCGTSTAAIYTFSGSRAAYSGSPTAAVAFLRLSAAVSSGNVTSQWQSSGTQVQSS